ncbi:MAG TPA: hypothetical protein D7I09_06415 [Candidatus Poseidoniales archaeon]|nr:MAG TPA: hypothetical protein D7I09_06415 [Candidatus Poseidoniales archaeon]
MLHLKRRGPCETALRIGEADLQGSRTSVAVTDQRVDDVLGVRPTEGDRLGGGGDAPSRRQQETWRQVEVHVPQVFEAEVQPH